ncbi:IAP100 protein [Ectocarpus siliculosus]|uniref:IAP100 protein n=1 Tax=Ectocarpus siliculosus TaxID=2880 RepID=D7FN32_ECTSI|nr:IAP100 protein [Ectocarpus siliculosus]|eukprot:CBJ30096.1 IAP100 protein [Ectocarpus siliculosus]
MLVEPMGKDSFKQIEEEVDSDPIKKSVSKMTPGVAKAVLTGVIPIASAVGYLAMPGGVAVSAIGAVASGVGGNLARKKLKQARQDSAPAQVAGLLDAKGVGNITPLEIMESLGSFGLEGEAAEDILIQIFSKYVVAMCQNSATKTSEIKELSELRETLGLDGLLMGEALYQAASPVYSQFVMRTPSAELADEWSPNRRALDKFIFLCDRMFEVCDTEEAYSFEMSRISKMFDLNLGEVKERCAAIANPFYQKALGSAAAKWESVKADQLKRARQTLGMDEEVAHEMHKEVYRSEALKLVKKDGEARDMKLDRADKARLGKLAAAFELSEEDATAEYESVVNPIYEELVVECLGKIMNEPETSKPDLARTYGELMMFSANTGLRSERAEESLRNIMTASVQYMFEDAAQYVRVANQKEGAKAARGMAAFVQSTLDMVSINVTDDETGEKTYNLVIGGSVISGESYSDAPGLYEMFLSSCFAQSAMEEGDTETIALLAKLLEIDELRQVKAYRDAAGPRVLRQLTESVQSGLETGVFPQEAKDANEALIESFKIPYVVIAEQAKDLYKKTLTAYAGGNRIITVDEKDSLDKMAEFLSMDSSAVDEIHAEMCSTTFQKAVAESMGATGVVAKEYRSKLDELAVRLGLSLESAKLMFHAAIRQRMGPMMQQIMYEFERSVLSKDQLAQKTGKDMGDDVMGAEGTLGIEGGAAVTSDVLALIDFYVDNGIIEEGEDGAEDVYPVTAKQIGGNSDEMVAALYQNFVVNGFSVEGEQLKRYEQGQSKLAGILGLEADVKMKIHREIGGTVIRRFVNQELAKQGKMSAQGVAFLANINSRLKMPQEMFESMVSDCKQDYVRRMADELFRVSVLSAKECKRLRTITENCGFTLENEGQLGLSARKNIFQIEAEDMIENGDMEGDDGKDFVEELQESLGLTTEDAQDALVALLESRSKGILENVKADAIERRDANILKAAERLLKYCRLAGGMAVENDLDQRQRNVIVNAYEAKHAGSIEEGSEGEAEERAKVAADLDLLKIAIGFTSE